MKRRYTSIKYNEFSGCCKTYVCNIYIDVLSGLGDKVNFSMQHHISTYCFLNWIVHLKIQLKVDTDK